MPTYPDYTDDIHGGYKAGVVYDTPDGARKVVFPSSYSEYRNAAAKARELQKALALAGDHNVKPMVTFWGERPPCFPRNGVILDKVKVKTEAESGESLPDGYGSPMTGEELSTIATRLHGQKHGRAVNLMRLTGLSRPTIDRQMGGGTVDPVLSRLARLLLQMNG